MGAGRVKGGVSVKKIFALILCFLMICQCMGGELYIESGNGWDTQYSLGQEDLTAGEAEEWDDSYAEETIYFDSIADSIYEDTVVEQVEEFPAEGFVSEEAAVETDSSEDQLFDGSFGFAIEAADDAAGFGSEIVGVENTTRDIVLLLDVSGSMSGTPMDAMKEAATLFCQKILENNDVTRIGIVVFGNSTGRIQGLTNDFEALKNAIAGLRSGGGTPLYRASQEANTMLTEKTTITVPTGDGGTETIDVTPSGEKYLVVMTDGEPDSRSNCTSYYQTLKDTTDYKIYSVGFLHSLSGTNKENAANFLRGIQNSGYFEASNIEELIEKFAEIAQTILKPLEAEVTHWTVDPQGFVYTIAIHVKNTNSNSDLTNVFAEIDVGDAVLKEGEKRQTEEKLAPLNYREFTWDVAINYAKYPDGGVYNCTIKIGADKTVGLEVEESIPFGAINSKSNELDFSKDVWKFKNIGKACKNHMSDEALNALMIGLSNSEKGVIRDALENDWGADGHCYGMSATVILNKMNILDLKNYTNAKTIRDAKEDDVRDLICYYMLLQKTDVMWQTVSPNTLEKYADNVSAFLIELAKMADDVKNGGTPVLLQVNSGIGGHVMAAYALEPGNFTSPVTQRTYDNRILVYDCNPTDLWGNVKWDANSSLYFNWNTGEWEVPNYVTSTTDGFISSDPNAAIQIATNDLELIDCKNMSTAVKNSKAVLEAQMATNFVLTLLDENGYDFSGEWHFNSDGTVQSGATKLLIMRPAFSAADAPFGIVLPDNKGAYKLSSEDSSVTEIKGNIRYDDFYMTVDASSAESALFTPSGKTALTNNQGPFKISVTDDNAPSDDYYTYTVSGDDSNGDVSVEMTPNGLKITADDTKGLTIVGVDDTGKAEATIEESHKSIVLKKQDNDVDVNHKPGTPPGIGTVLNGSDGNFYQVTKVSEEVAFFKIGVGLTMLVIPATVNIEGVTYKVTSVVRDASRGNSRIKGVEIGSNVVTIGRSAFNGCTQISRITIGSKVKEIGPGAFQNCRKLSSVTIPSKVKTIGKNAFYGCKKLTKIKIKTTKLTESSVGAKAFKGVYSTVKVYVPSSLLSKYKTLLLKKGLTSSAKIKKL